MTRHERRFLDSSRDHLLTAHCTLCSSCWIYPVGKGERIYVDGDTPGCWRLEQRCQCGGQYIISWGTDTMDLVDIRATAGSVIKQADKMDHDISILTNRKYKAFWEAIELLFPGDIRKEAEDLLEDLYVDSEDRSMEDTLVKAAAIMKQFPEEPCQ